MEALKKGSDAKIFIGGVEIKGFSLATLETQDSEEKHGIVETFCEECKDFFPLNTHGHFTCKVKMVPSNG